MRLSLDWLKDFIEVNIPVEELAHRLTMAGIAVENIEKSENDTVLELELTPNRGDCLGIINVAREVSALTGIPLDLPQGLPDELDERIDDYIKVSIKSNLCSRYAARVMKNVRVGPSPVWMQERLEKAGVRPINNVVDVTNYVMLETNQPMHAFDYDLLEGKQIIVRNARDDESLVTLDGGERRLDPSMLVIADADKPVALAGVMGGESSEINEHSTIILLESAVFDGISVRKTAKKMALRTEASIRFEKGVDIEGVIPALDRAARLLEILGAGEVLQGIDDVYPEPKPVTKIRLRPDRVNAVLSAAISVDEIRDYLQKLQFIIEDHGPELMVTVPSFRPDVIIEEDLIEEIARLYGYDNISSDLERAQPTQGYRTDYQRFLQEILLGSTRWMHQIITYSFINPRWLDVLMVPTEHFLRTAVRVANPFSEEQGIMRTTLLPGLLETADRNISRRNEDLCLVELGNVYWPREDHIQPEERMVLAGLVSGKAAGGWQGSGDYLDFFYLKGIVEQILGAFNLPSLEFLPLNPDHSYHPGRAASILLEGSLIGSIGEIHPTVLEQVGINKRTCVFELDAVKVFEALIPRNETRPIPKFPAIKRDLALIVAEQVNAADLSGTIWESGQGLLVGVDLFDVYRSLQLGEDKKSLAFALTFQSLYATLQDDEINDIMETILKRAEEIHGAKIR
ncbi:MAG: phenylalanine--tRNA ligase subunit beta [Syntrophomonadaceae bacterium]|nr:phenylalanine--tRNA ligase subunit beta [Syntrophomonadaceae bacterium]